MIDLVLSAQNYTQVFPDLKSWKSVYVDLAQSLHPDTCKDPRAQDAMAKLNSFKDIIEKGRRHQDEVGEIRYYPDRAVITGDPAILKLSKDNYDRLMSFTDSDSRHFQKYLPERMILNGNSLEVFFRDQGVAVPISQFTSLDQKHVNWVVSRMLEFAGWLQKKGYAHAGLTPDSCYIYPESHGLCVINFYHMTKLGERMKTVSGPYALLYPAHVFNNKTATPDIDAEMAKRVGIFLLGDRSGAGAKLKKVAAVNQSVLDFYMHHVTDAISAFLKYRMVIQKEFKKEFVKLENF